MSNPKIAIYLAFVVGLAGCTSEDHQVGIAAASAAGPSSGGDGQSTHSGGTRPDGAGGLRELGGRSALSGTGGSDALGAAGREVATGGAGGAAAGASGAGGAGGITGFGGAGGTAGLASGGASQGIGGGVTSCPRAACRDESTCVEVGPWTTCQCDAVELLPPCPVARFRNLGHTRSWAHFGLGAMSDDGSLLMGCAMMDTTGPSQAVSWTLAGGLVPLPVPGARCAHVMSHDGSVVAGTIDDKSSVNFLWTPDGVEYPNLPGAISGMSREGDAFFGNDISIPYRAFYVVRGQAPVTLGVDTYGMSISADGKHVVGYRGSVPFHFSRERGLVSLPTPSGAVKTIAQSVSPDGSMIVGYAEIRESNTPVLWMNDVLVTPDPLIAPVGESSTVVNRTWTAAAGLRRRTDSSLPDAVLWTKGVGWRRVADLLRNAGVDLTGWHLETTSVVSADGKTLTGSAQAPDQRFVRWFAQLP